MGARKDFDKKALIHFFSKKICGQDLPKFTHKQLLTVNH